MNEHAMLIYYNHFDLKGWKYYHPEQAWERRCEMLNIREMLIVGLVTEVKAGCSFTIEGMFKDECLYPMLVKFKDAHCANWMLLQQKGSAEDMEWTPYLFTRNKDRIKAMRLINEPISNQQVSENPLPLGPSDRHSKYRDIKCVTDALDAGGTLVYFNHTVDRWCYVKAPRLEIGYRGLIITGSKSSFGTEVRRIRERCLVGSVEEIKEIDCIFVNDMVLYPMLVKYKDTKCRNWTSFSQTTATDEIHWTPYLFTDAFIRRETFEWIAKPVLDYQTCPDFPEGY